MTGPDLQRSPSLGRRILRAGVAVGIAHVAFKLAGILQAVVMTRYVDKGVLDVVYAGIFENCVFAAFLVGEEAIGPAFLPVFMQELDTGHEDSAWSFANTILTIQWALLFIVVSLMMLFPATVINIFSGGAWSAAQDPARFALARSSLVLLAPALFALSIGSTTYMLLNGYKRFFLAAFGDASWKFCALLAVLVGMGVFGFDFRALIVGLLVGSAAKLVTHLIGLRDHLRRFRLSFRINTLAVRRMALLILPLIAGIVFAKVRDVYNNFSVLSQSNVEGLMIANSLGRKLYVAIGWLVPYALSIAMFPFLCELVDRDDRKQFGSILSQSGRMLLSVFIPFSLVCIVLAEPIAAMLFRSDRFDAGMVNWTAVSMACYTLVLPAYALEYLLMQAFFARRKMISVTVVGVSYSTLSIGISYIGVAVLGATGAKALAIVAIGFTVSRILKSTTLVAVLKRQIPMFPIAETGIFLGKALLVGVVATAACALALRALDGLLPTLEGRVLRLLQLGAGGSCALAAYVLAMLLLRLREPLVMVQWAVARIRRRPEQIEV